MNKKDLTEADIRTKFITPALDKDKHGSWDLMTQLLEEHYFTKGRVIVRGQTVSRGQAKKADYILFYKPNIPVAVIEAKDNNQPVEAGMQQALDYAETLDLPFAYSSNGDAFLEHNRITGANPVEREIPLDQFPSPDELWQRYSAAKGYTPRQQAVATSDYYDDGSGKEPRYYQINAINRAVDAFDLICHIAYDQSPLTRQERADGVKKRNVFGKYGDKARAVREALLCKYADSGIQSVESMEILKVDPLRGFGTPIEIVQLFGGKAAYRAAIHDLENALYAIAA